MFSFSFKTTEVALMMDWEDSSGSSGSEEEQEESWIISQAVSNMRETRLSTTRGSMRGLQIAIAEGWLIHRARDMCAFAHDRYRQAAIVESRRYPEDKLAKMAFRVISFLYLKV